LVLELSIAVPGHGVAAAQLADYELGDGYGEDAVVGGAADRVGAGRLLVAEDHFDAAVFLRPDLYHYGVIIDSAGR
jgi:hypothetical protein